MLRRILVGCCRAGAKWQVARHAAVLACDGIRRHSDRLRQALPCNVCTTEQMIRIAPMSGMHRVVHSHHTITHARCDGMPKPWVMIHGCAPCRTSHCVASETMQGFASTKEHDVRNL